MPGLLIGAALVLAAWHGLRRSVGAGWRRTPVLALALDGGPVLGGFAVALAASARPILSALFVAGTAAGLALADRTKRAVLNEPVVFADRAELFEVVRHPRLYLPFAGTWRVLGIALALAACVGTLAWVEPPAWRLPLLPGGMLLAAGALAAAAACLWIPTWPPILRRLHRIYEAVLAPTRDPVKDAARWGLLGSAIVHATIARAERPMRQQQAAAARPRQGVFRADAGPIVLVQAESFMDPRRLHPAFAAAVPHWAALEPSALLSGRLSVPCWGANTVRTEFAVLTGLPDAQLGLDRFNPYEAFARRRLPSLAWQAREAGYRTIFVHPFDLGFYGRNQVLPNLGFEELVGPEAFRGAGRAGAYVADVEVARVVARLVRERGPRVLVLAVTMENHGPWDGVADPAPPEPLPPALAGLPDAAPLGRWLRHLRGTDAMLPVLTDALRDAAGAPAGAEGAEAGASPPGWLVFYGDHQPSMPGALRTLLPSAPPHHDQRTDYLAWHAGAALRDARAGGPRPQRDLAAHELGDALLRLASHGPVGAAAAAAGTPPSSGRRPVLPAA